MARVSFTEVWDQTRDFVAKELSLLAPVALTWSVVPLLLLSIVMPDPLAIGGTPAPGLWTIWLIPLIIVVEVIGWLTLVAMALVPAISVGEAMRRSFRRLPIALAALALLAVVALGVLLLIGSVINVISTAASLGRPGTLKLKLVSLLVLMAIATTRLALLWPTVADGDGGPIKSVRRALQLTAGEFWHLLGLLVLAIAVWVLLSLTASLAGGAVMLLLGRMVHSEALGRTLALALNAVVVGLWQMVTLVYVAFLYRAFVKAGKAG